MNIVFEVMFTSTAMIKKIKILWVGDKPIFKVFSWTIEETFSCLLFMVSSSGLTPTEGWGKRWS